MKAAILGGTFDPIHLGHLYLAKAAMTQLGLEQVMVLPLGEAPHKQLQATREQRLAMAQLAVQGEDGLFVSTAEIDRPGTTYTVDTMRILTEKFPDTQWVYLLGEDTLNVLDSWREFSQVAKMCSFAVVHRPGGLKEKTAGKMRFLKEKYAAQIQLLPVSGPDISSTQVRAMAARRQDIGDVVPPAVKAYIAQEGLYLCAKPWPQVKEEIRARLKPSRYAHTLGVADTAREMALRFGEDPAAAYAAGLLHDVAKYMSMDEMRALSQTLTGEFAVDDEELASEALLHAAAGCVVARDEFGVVDEKILRAIRFHTLGGANMDALTAILYVADFVEPGRRVFDGLEEARALARTDLYAAVRKCAQLTLEYVRSRHENPHPRTMQILSENIAGGDFK